MSKIGQSRFDFRSALVFAGECFRPAENPNARFYRTHKHCKFYRTSQNRTRRNQTNASNDALGRRKSQTNKSSYKRRISTRVRLVRLPHIWHVALTLCVGAAVSRPTSRDPSGPLALKAVTLAKFSARKQLSALDLVCLSPTGTIENPTSDFCGTGPLPTLRNCYPDRISVGCFGSSISGAAWFVRSFPFWGNAGHFDSFYDRRATGTRRPYLQHNRLS